jgi:hypothetical protein
MKNIILLVAMLSLCVGILFAQPVYGVRAGLNMASLTGEDNMDDYGSKIGLHIGAMMQYPVAPSIIFQPELLYTMKGATAEFDYGIYGKDELTWSHNYLEIPMLIKYNVEMPTVKIQPYIGPSVGILVSAKGKAETSGDESKSSTTTDIKEYMNTLELGLNLGVDAIVMQNIMVGLRFDMGLSKIAKEDEGYQSKLKNNVIMLNFGYLLGN